MIQNRAIIHYHKQLHTNIKCDWMCPGLDAILLNKYLMWYGQADTILSWSIVKVLTKSVCWEKNTIIIERVRKEDEFRSRTNHLRNKVSNSLTMISTMPFCTGMSVAISMESVSALMTVGPNTMATLVACILFTDPNSTTLHKERYLITHRHGNNNSQCEESSEVSGLT